MDAENLVLVLIGGLSILTILFMRWLVRILAARVGVWGEPVAVVASKEKLENLMGYFMGGGDPVLYPRCEEPLEATPIYQYK